ncbi:hypothetical protein [Hymenobacter segetis]|uniref:Uncharacterized protein n=1 Tax=Hymenobacter segetis TaxID=2025509 RepID=A0ABU9LWC8_9BACT
MYEDLLKSLRRKGGANDIDEFIFIRPLFWEGGVNQNNGFSCRRYQLATEQLADIAMTLQGHIQMTRQELAASFWKSKTKLPASSKKAGS